MSDLNIDPKQISESLKETLGNWSDEVKDDLVGYVASIADGVARVKGLENAMSSELLEFPGGLLGVALNLDEDSIGVVLMGDSDHIQEGMPVKQTGEVLSIGVGDGFLGRVIDTLGNPIDGKGPIEFTERRLMETQAPTVVERQPVGEPLQTGIKAIDSMIPIGRGQRELIIGDRGIGKTAVAIDTIINQKDTDVKCIYVAIGQKSSTVAEVVARLESEGVLDKTVIVNAPASAAAALQMYAPYAGSAIGQHWMYNGEHALIVFDDLSKQAIAYRQISLLLRRPPGREAYPGDVFYLHSRLLERCAKVSEDLGGGSMTGLPIIETKAGDVSAFIPTNVISITDGQIYLESELFYSGVRPAVNPGTSVSRVGGAAQTKAMKKVSGPLRINLAQFRELEAFAEFGSDLDAASQSQLDRGIRVVEMLKQPQYEPVATEDQVIALYAVTEGYFDKVPVDGIYEAEKNLLEFVKTRYSDMVNTIKETGELPGDELKDAVIAFVATLETPEED
ncbi:F0F1 ATP synthase subunit alpha [Acidimicrobiia bacterium]|nr:F0F1 ATP synthase subunit alpha [Actinomycetota bacterium]MDA7543822.1 F0F1 ATP synthase subunit alpha [Acidimicrobiia bacterium]MDA8653264.1 F0F1 ATP synthase subunit alpha [Candidatus Actinomarina sp.]MBT3873208.1 F0F1 ATP synthase subunit alpha [Actinomycetota bacterium]MDA7548182.1 F0F1 ATP synthase subunit alpha [Acidimicrobiia bacterium]